MMYLGAQDTDYVPCAIVLVPIIAGLLFVLWTVRRDMANAKESANRVRARSDFAATDVYVSPWDQTGVAIDVESSRLLIVRANEQRIVAAGEVISVEVIADNSTLVKTNRGSQALGAGIGGFLFGPAGFVVGGLSGSNRSERRITQLMLRVVTTDFAYPNHDVVLYKSIDPKGDAPDSVTVSSAMRVAETWHSRISALVRAGDTPPPPAPVVTAASIADELRKLEDLRLEGVLTNQEFAGQKQLLLDQRPPHENP
jgi:hypothetical protein